MAERISDLNRVDPAPVEYSDFSPEMKRWLSDLVDILNSALQQIEDAINAIP